MYRTNHNAYERACDCTCPIHHGQPRATYTNPGCYCLATCASQPMTVLAPQIGGALFLDAHNALWFVQALEPGHWDWRYATAVNIGHPLFEVGTQIAGFLRDTHLMLLPLVHPL